MMDNFSQILLRMLTVTDSPSMSNRFWGVNPFKVHIKFDIPLFEGKIDADALEKWLSLLEGYFSIQKFSDSEKITFALVKSLPHVKDWWDGYCERHVRDESNTFNIEPTWSTFFDFIKEEFYPTGNYDDQ